MATPYKTFSYHTFGCKVNFADSSFIARELIGKGFSQVPINSNADISLINTCSVTENADKKANKLIKDLYNRFPETKIIVYGCYAQLKPIEISKLKGVALVVGAKDKFKISDIIASDDFTDNVNFSDINEVSKFNISYSLNERTRAFIKIQDGCNYTCTYCTIPNARGKSRSLNVEDTVNEIKNIVEKGSKEIILSGINIGDFGLEQGEKFSTLLENVELIDDLDRYRISSIEPNLLTKEILKIISKSEKAMPHLHIPMQSGSDKILKLMQRRYTSLDYVNVIDKVRSYFPDACIGVDVIVGFPSETEDDFNETYNTLNNLDISYLHVFSYSERNNTKSQGIIPKVPQNEIVTRRNKLRALSTIKYKEFVFKNLNSKKNILFEKYDDGLLSGWTENYIRVNVEGSKRLINQIKKIKLTNHNSGYTEGILI